MYSLETGPSKIKDGLYLGNMEDSKNLKELQELGIKYILVAGNCLDLYYPNFFVYKHIPINDHAFENIDIYFDDAYEFIKNGIKEGGCFVHCALGVSRSASMVIAYLMKENSWKLEPAFIHVRKQRSIVYPNYGFQKQLKKFEIKLGLITEDEYLKLINEKITLLSKNLGL